MTNLVLDEQQALSREIVTKLLDMTARQHSTMRSSQLLPQEMALQVASSDYYSINTIINESARLVEFNGSENGLTIHLSFDKIKETLARIEKVEIPSRLLLETYLKKGASSFCMHDLFSISKAQFVTLRKQHKIKISSAGCMSEGELYEAKINYEKVNRGASFLKQDLLDVSENTGVSLNTVWHAVRNPINSEGVRECQKRIA